MAAVLQKAFWNAPSWRESVIEEFKYIEICSQGSNWQYVIIYADNVSSPNRLQAVI